jgi:hypothetical protein
MMMLGKYLWVVITIGMCCSRSRSVVGGGATAFVLLGGGTSASIMRRTTTTPGGAPSLNSRDTMATTSMEMMGRRRRKNFMKIYNYCTPTQQLLGLGYAYSQATARAREAVLLSTCSGNKSSRVEAKLQAARKLRRLRNKRPLAIIKSRARNLGLVVVRHVAKIRKFHHRTPFVLSQDSVSGPGKAYSDVTAQRRTTNSKIGSRVPCSRVVAEEPKPEKTFSGRGHAYSYLLSKQEEEQEKTGAPTPSTTAGKKKNSTPAETTTNKPANLGQAYSFFVLQNSSKESGSIGYGATKQTKAILDYHNVMDNTEHSVKVLQWPPAHGNALWTPSRYDMYKRKGD